MHVGRTVFAQLMDFIPRHEFRQIVRQYRGEHRLRRFSCWDQFMVMAFAQLTYRESLRDIETCLQALAPTLYHAGIRHAVPRSTLADANEKRPWQIYHDLALSLVADARSLYRNDQLVADLDSAVYAFDATNIELCLSLFPWATAANHLKTSAGIKLHTLFHVQSELPVFTRVSVAHVREVLMMDELFYEPGAYYLFDRGYTDFARLHRIEEERAFFVIRAKRDLRFRRIYSGDVDKTLGILSDQIGRLIIKRSREGYPGKLRRITCLDLETNEEITLLTNNFDLPATTIGQMYRSRWRIELFFKWIKQHLRIKAFYGTTPNAVHTQVWIALTVYVLVAIARKRLKLELPMYTILQTLSLTLFEKTPINQLLASAGTKIDPTDAQKQLNLFDS
jgi:hypothetical protein